MTECVTRDSLIDLATAAPRTSLQLVDHLARCEACRRELAAMDAFRASAATGGPVPAGFTDAVMRRIEAERATEAAPPVEGGVAPVRAGSPYIGPLRRLRAVAAALLQAVLIAGAVATVLTAAAAGSPAADLSLSPSPAHLALAFLLALGVGIASAVRTDTPEDDGIPG